jgi:hypothetical protein
LTKAKTFVKSATSSWKGFKQAATKAYKFGRKVYDKYSEVKEKVDKVREKYEEIKSDVKERLEEQSDHQGRWDKFKGEMKDKAMEKGKEFLKEQGGKLLDKGKDYLKKEGGKFLKKNVGKWAKKAWKGFFKRDLSAISEEFKSLDASHTAAHILSLRS